MNYSFNAGSGNQIGVGPYIERSERSSIRNWSGVSRVERGLVSKKNGGRSGRAGFERGCIWDTARIQRGLIGDKYVLQSERIIFNRSYPTNQLKLIGIGRGLVGCLV